MAVFIGLVALVLLPRSTEDARSLIPCLEVLNARQRYILTTRLLSGNPSKKNAQKVHIKAQDVWRALTAWRVYPILLFCLAWTAPVSTLETYNALITTDLGFSTIKGNALSSVGYWIQIPILLFAGFTAYVTLQFFFGLER